MKYIRFSLLLIFILSITDVYSQSWKRERDHIVLGLGGTGFMGDLGGSTKEGSQYMRDYNFSSMRPVGLLGYRYFFIQDAAVRGHLAFGYISGDDSHIKLDGPASPDDVIAAHYRLNRNLNFRSPILELGVQAEYYFLRAYQMGARYRRLTKARGWFGYNFSAYAFLGINGFYFNPQGKFESANYKGSVAAEDLPSDGWYSLRPLKTEGQDYFSTRSQYSPVSISIPFGLGAIFVINRQLSVGLEYGFRTTWTDYIDDVSRTYVDPAIYSEMYAGDPHKIALAEYFSNPTIGILGDNATYPGQQRGNPHNTDAYMFTLITVYYNVPQKRGPGLPRF
ncbi:MAG: hypothetical protein KGZ97_00810 [Bacteroidetes bacterium]|nr:hypothetical protein [Bacteroidota bacterium]